MKRIIIKDTILELWRGNISYIILTIMAIGLIQSIAITNAIKEFDWFRVIESVNIRKFGYISSLFIFSYIWKGITLSILSSFAFSKYNFSKQLSFIYYNVSKNTYLLLRLIGIILFLSIFFTLWDIVLTVFAVFLKIFTFNEIFVFSIIGDIILFIFLPVPLFWGLYFSPISAGFVSLIIFFVGVVPSISTPFFGIQISNTLKQILIQFPNATSLVLFIPLKYLNVPIGLYDIYPNIRTLVYYLIQSILYLVLFFRQQRQVEL